MERAPYADAGVAPCPCSAQRAAEVPQDREWLSRSDVARLSGLSYETVKRLTNRTDAEHLPARRFGRAVRIRRADYEAWADAQPDY